MVWRVHGVANRDRSLKRSVPLASSVWPLGIARAPTLQRGGCLAPSDQAQPTATEQKFIPLARPKTISVVEHGVVSLAANPILRPAGAL
jgi:hypothetical protein